MNKIYNIRVEEDKPLPLQLTLDSEVPPGQYLRVRGNSLSMLNGLAIKRITTSGEGESCLAVERIFTREDRQRNFSKFTGTKAMALLKTREALPRGTVVTVEAVVPGETNADGSLNEFRNRISGIFWEMELRSVSGPDDTDGESVAEPVRISFRAGNAAEMAAWRNPDGDVRIQYFDKFGNPAAKPAGALYVENVECALPESGSLKAGTVQIREPSEYGPRVEVRDDAGHQVLSSPQARGFESPIWFGEVHWHCEFSGDGQRDLAEAMASARDELALDFAGPSDHMGRTATYAGGTVEEQVDICGRFDEPGRFAVVYGGELSGRYGHTNIYAEDADTWFEVVGKLRKQMEGADYPNSYPWQELLRSVVEGKSFIVPHHTNTDSYTDQGIVRPQDGRPFWCAMDWPMPADQNRVRLVEMLQTRGAFETETVDPEWRVEVGGFGSSVQSALMKGYRLGFLGGTDNHQGWPTRGRYGEFCGITGVLCDRLDGKELFRALYNRRCYATTGARMVCDATLNGYPIGSEIRMNPGEERHFKIKVNGTAPLDKVQVISAGVVLADLDIPGNSWDFDGEWSDDRPGKALNNIYYYVRIRQKDGHCAWLSPFWCQSLIP